MEDTAMNWTVAAVQMDCRLADPNFNRNAVVEQVKAAAKTGAKLAVFPECIITGYSFPNRKSLVEMAETLPGPTTEALTPVCRDLGIHAVVGMVESEPSSGRLFNACALVGPQGFIAGYRKVHLPCMGLDRFMDRGDRPFAVYDIGGFKVGMAICFDGSFPEAARLLTLAGADIIVLPTNWATQAQKMADLICRVRALENHVYFMPVNRTGDEGGFHFIGLSAIVNCAGDFINRAEHDRPAIVTAEIDPAVARNKHVIHCAGEYEIDRINWRRPDLYGPLVTPIK
jgi:5-aminopentanamidase